MPSRQLLKQRSNLAAGLCPCGKPRPRNSTYYCGHCRKKESLRRRKRLHCKPWRPGGRGRPPLWYTDAVRRIGRKRADARAERLFARHAILERMEQA